MFSIIFPLLSILPALPVSTVETTDSVPASIDVSMDEAERLREKYRLQMERKNSVGSTAADFHFVTRSGEQTSLHELRTEGNLLLIFYDPDCDDCHEAMKSLAGFNASGKFHVVAIDSEEDRERWEQTASSLPEDWTVGFATDPIQDDETYYIMTMPTIYLLDKDKTVLLKDTTLEKAFQYN